MMFSISERAATWCRSVLVILSLISFALGNGGEGDEFQERVPVPNNKLKTAQGFYQRQVAKNDQDADSWHGLAVVLRRMEMHAEAAVAMTRAVEVAPTAVRHRELGLILRLAGYEERGVHHLIESARGGALSPTTLLMIGRFQHHQGQVDLGARTLLLALRLTDPALRGGHAVALTMCLLDAKNYSEAQKAFRSAARDHLFLPSSLPSSSASSPPQPELNPMLGIVWPSGTPLSLQRLRYRRGLEQQQQLCRARRAERRRAREDASHLANLLRAQQFPPKHACSSAPLLVYVLSGESGGVGLGCEFHGLALALAMAIRTNRTLVLAPSRWWLAGRANGGGSGGGGRQAQWTCAGNSIEDVQDPSGYECFFEPLSSCRAVHILTFYCLFKSVCYICP